MLWIFIILGKTVNVGLKLEALADLAGTTLDYIWAIEHGKLLGIEVASKRG